VRTRGLAVVLALAALAATGCAVANPKPVTGVTGAAATLNGDVYSNLAGSTQYWWRYGTTTAYGFETTHRSVAINDNQGHPVSEPLAGLSASTAYHVQMCAQDGSSPPRAVCSKDGTFTTLAPAGERALTVAQQYRGTPFFYGGANPATGFDDDGLVQYAFGQAGVTLPRISYQQFEVGAAVTLANLQAGDLVFFRSAAGDIYHVGIYEGGGSFFHAPHTGDVLKSNSLNEPFYAAQFAGGRRISG
jgi:cell wall-associated NlpC family hydrolase